MRRLLAETLKQNKIRGWADRMLAKSQVSGLFFRPFWPARPALLLYSQLSFKNVFSDLAPTGVPRFRPHFSVIKQDIV